MPHRANNNSMSPQLYVPYWALAIDELLPMTPLGGVGDADRAVILERIRSLKFESLAEQRRPGVNGDVLTVSPSRLLKY